MPPSRSPRSGYRGQAIAVGSIAFVLNFGTLTFMLTWVQKHRNQQAIRVCTVFLPQVLLRDSLLSIISLFAHFLSVDFFCGLPLSGIRTVA